MKGKVLDGEGVEGKEHGAKGRGVEGVKGTGVTHTICNLRRKIN